MEQILQIILIILSGGFFFVSAVGFTCEMSGRRLVCSEKIQRRMLIYFVLLLTLLAYIWMPKNNDLTRHMIRLDKIRASGVSFRNFMRGSSVNNNDYIYLFAFNAYCHAIANTFSNSHMLPAITVLIIYSIWAYLVYDSRNHRAFCVDFTTLMLCFGLLPFIFSNSGIRNGLASSLSALAVYGHLKKQKSFLYFTILELTAILIHPVAALAVPFVILTRFHSRVISFLLVFLLSFFISHFAGTLVHAGNPFLRLIGSKFVGYTASDQYFGSKFYLYGDWIFIACVIVAWLITDKKRLQEGNSSCYPLFRFQILYIIFVMGFAGNYDLILRPMYMIGILAPTLQPLFDEENWKPNFKIVGLALKCICVLISSYVLWRYMGEYIKCQIWYAV